MSRPPALLSARARAREDDVSADGDERPTRVRYGVLAFLAAMTFVLYLDRVCINQAAPDHQERAGDLGDAEGDSSSGRSPWPMPSSRFRPGGGATATARGAS